MLEPIPLNSYSNWSLAQLINQLIDTVLLCSEGSICIHYVAQVGLELKAAVSQVLGLQVYIITPGFLAHFKTGLCSSFHFGILLLGLCPYILKLKK